MKRKLRNLAKQVGVKLVFCKLYNASGLYDRDSHTVYLDPTLDDNMLASYFFHELGHHYCWMFGKYKRYHETTDYRLMAKIGLRAERYVDKIGREMFEEEFPEGQYYACYAGEDARDWHRASCQELAVFWNQVA